MSFSQPALINLHSEKLTRSIFSGLVRRALWEPTGANHFSLSTHLSLSLSLSPPVQLSVSLPGASSHLQPHHHYVYPPFPPSRFAREKNSTGEVFNSNFICGSAARKLTQQSLESKVALGSALTVLYANRAAPGQWSRPAESLLMQI